MMLAAPAKILAFCVCSASQLILPAPHGDALPTDVSGSARGLHALHVDAAATGDLPGAALQVRHVGTPGVRGTGALALAVAAPLGPLSVALGTTWGNLPDPKSALYTLGLSARLSPRLRLGLNVQRYKPTAAWAARTVLDGGILWVPHRVVSVSVGVDAANAPGFSRNVHMRRALRAGVGLRPLRGDSILTLGADARMTWANGGHFPDVRAVVDVAPYEGLHLLGAYQRYAHEHVAWAGLSLDVMGAEFLGAGRAAHSTPQSAADRMALALTLQRHDRRSLPLNIQKEVHVDVAGDLIAKPGAPWQRREAIAMLPARLARLAQVPDVAQVTLHIGALDVGHATVSELRAAVAALRAEGKRVVAHLQVADTKAYLVAAAASCITMDPVGTLDIRGPSLRHHYFAGALQHLGLRIEAVAHGRYKTAPESFTQAGPSEAQREVSCGIVGELYDRLLLVLQQNRGLTAQAAHGALAQGPMGAQQALMAKLIDGVSVQPGGGGGAGPKGLSQGRMGPDNSFNHEPIWGPGPRIAIVALTGIVAQASSSALPGASKDTSDSVVHALGRAQADPTVVGVVLRIDSPGGDVVAAEEVYRAVHAVSLHKPVAVSMGDVAASGGYWAALGGSKIFAEPETLTGSIGIYSLQLDASPLLAKVGITSSVMGRGERAGTGSWEEPMGEGERAQAQDHLDGLYTLFVQRVAQHRRLTPKRAEELAQGRVYTGLQAQKLGLVDALGGMHEALQWVARAAKVQGDEALVWQVPRGPMRLPGPLGLWAASNMSVAQKGLMQDAAQLWLPLVQRLHNGALGPQAIALGPEGHTLQTGF